MKYLLYSLILFFLSGGFASSQDLLVRYPAPENKRDFRDQYYIEMLSLALEKTKPAEGNFRLEASAKVMTQNRAVKSLLVNKYIDISWTMTSKQREQQLLPIRIPLLKGLLGNRVFIIRRQDKERFAKLDSLEKLKALKAGQGHDWPDLTILKKNGLQTVSGSKYEGLFSMLVRGRFDYFPRGLNEPWSEVRTHSYMDLVVEESLLLQYPAPIYFFVNVENVALAERIEKGLLMAMEDGSFDQLFCNHPSTNKVFTLAKMDGRKVFQLTNPLLPSATPLDNNKLWYQPHLCNQLASANLDAGAPLKFDVNGD